MSGSSSEIVAPRRNSEIEPAAQAQWRRIIEPVRAAANRQGRKPLYVEKNNPEPEERSDEADRWV